MGLMLEAFIYTKLRVYRKKKFIGVYKTKKEKKQGVHTHLYT